MLNDFKILKTGFIEFINSVFKFSNPSNMQNLKYQNCFFGNDDDKIADINSNFPIRRFISTNSYEEYSLDSLCLGILLRLIYLYFGGTTGLVSNDYTNKLLYQYIHSEAFGNMDGIFK